MADIRIDFGFDDLNKANKLLKELQKAAKNIRASMKETGKAVEADLQKAKQFATATKKIATEKKKLTSIEREQLRLERALASTEAKITLATSKTNKTLIEKRKQLTAINRQLRTGGKNTAGWASALGSFQFKFNALGNVAANVTSAISRSVNRALRDAVKVVVDFDQAMADVKAITGATGKEFDALSDSARQLGGTTKFTASEVAKLQKEYAKLGLTTKEILKAQAATLDLAAATNTELPRAAEVVGITIRQFGLDAAEAGRVTDVMARSFTSSALDMEKFAEAMKFVGPAAKASGISLERTTAILGQLADAGISGSMAGTSLRQIMLALSKESGTFTEKIRAAAKGGLDLAGASEEVQKRAATALLVLADGVDTVDAFTESLEDAAGAAKDMADVQLDTLAGQATLVKSAWEGMILAMLSTEENLNGVKWALDGIINFLNIMALKSSDQFEVIGPRFTTSAFAQAAALNKLAREAEEYAIEIEKSKKAQDEFFEGFGQIGGWVKEFGKNLWNEIFPKDPEVIEDLENIDRLLKRLDEYAFKEEDQAAIMPEIGQGLIVSDETIKEGGDKIEELAKLQSNAIDDEIKQDEESEAEKTRIAKEGADARAKIVDQGFSISSNAITAFTNLFAKQKERELSAAGDNAAKRLAIEKEYLKKEQALAAGQVIVDTASAIIATYRSYGGFTPAAIAFSAAMAGIGAIQLAAIKNQQFAKGEIDINGPSHSRGGIQAEIEGGESVINKRSTGKYRDLLEAINKDDQVRIMDAMGRDKKITVKGGADPYNKKLYELMKNKETYGEDDKFYIKHKGGTTFKVRKK